MKKIAEKLGIAAVAAALLANSFAFAACDGKEHEHVAGEAVKENVVAATCSQTGSYDEVVYCADCEEELSRTPKTIAKTPHTPSLEPTIENEGEPLCDGTGGDYEVYRCVDCNEITSRTRITTEVVPHSYSENWSKDSTGHWHACTVCGDKEDFNEHTPGPAATATSSQVCLDCGYVIATPIGHTHSPVAVDAVAPDCFTPGNIAYYTCDCGEWFTDERATEIIDNHDDVVLKATGHAYAESWSYDETGHWHAATCGHEATSEFAAHTYGATGTASGDKVSYKCTVCDYVDVRDTFTVTYNYNYAGAPSAVSAKVEEGKTVSTPANFTRSGYCLAGWYTDAALGTEYDVSSPLNGNLQLYAKWATASLNVLEAEYINLAGIKGVGYSSETSGTGLIQSDYQGAANASNGYYVGYLYRYSTTLTFRFTSSVEVYDAQIALRLSGELVTELSLTSNEFLVKVNGEQLNFETIVIKDIDPSTSKQEKREFQDFTVGTGVHLLAGENTITLTVNNSKTMVSNMRSTAPLLDCVKVYAGSEITFNPILSNLDRFNN